MENGTYEKSLYGIRSQLKYRKKNHIILIGDYDMQKMIQEWLTAVSPGRNVEFMFLYYKEPYLIRIQGYPYDNFQYQKIKCSQDESYFAYVRDFFEEILKYYFMDTVKCSFVWMAGQSAGKEILEALCRKKGCYFICSSMTEICFDSVADKLEKRMAGQLPVHRKKMKIAVAGHMGQYYSGGRYHAWIWAESLAYMGNDVYFIANQEPIFIRDTTSTDYEGSLTWIISDHFDINIEGVSELDYVFMIPYRTLSNQFYYQVRNLSMRTNARLLLLNFEAPNWMNHYLHGSMDEKLWDQWRETCDSGCMVISTDRESTKFAKEYYTTNPEYTVFQECYLSLNTKIANEVPLYKKENRVVSFIRLKDKHKGSQDILKLFDPVMKGYTFIFVIGTNVKNEDFKEFEKVLIQAEDNYGISYEIKTKISDAEKYKEISRAKYLLFPSYFEGYGIPPIEAMYFNTRCIAYDLPVIHEVCGNGVTYCRYGDPEDMKNKLIALMQEDRDFPHLRDDIFEIADFEHGAERLHRILFSRLEEDWRSPFAEYLEIE